MDGCVCHYCDKQVTGKCEECLVRVCDIHSIEDVDMITWCRTCYRHLSAEARTDPELQDGDEP